MHRPLIRATLPRQEGQPPPPRQGPDFTIRQPGGRPPPIPFAPAAWGPAIPGQPIRRRRHGRADARRHAAPEQWPSTDDVALTHPARSAGQKAFQVEQLAASLCSAVTREPCPVSPASTVSSLVSPTSGRFPGRSPRRPRPQARGSRSPIRASASKRTFASSRRNSTTRSSCRVMSPATNRLRNCRRRWTASSAASTSLCTGRRSRDARSSTIHLSKRRAKVSGWRST